MKSLFDRLTRNKRDRPSPDASSIRLDAIWRTVRRIPRGRVSTYGRVAKLAGLPGRARLVGMALRQTPFGLRIPWHRVVNSAGRISLPKFNGMYNEQKERLMAENIRFVKDRIDLKHYGWPA